MKQSNEFALRAVPGQYIRLTCLLLVGVLEIAAMSLGGYSNYQELCVFYINALAMLFLGASVVPKMTQSSWRLIILGLAVCAWPLLLQLSDFRFITAEDYPEGRFLGFTFLCSYGMLFSFASLSGREERTVGMKLFGCAYLISAVILTVFSVLFIKGVELPVPDGSISWREYRLYLMWNPNIAARIFLIAVGFCLIYFLMTGRKWLKAVLIGLIALFMMVLCFLACRTVNILLCCMIGAVVFFCIYRKGPGSALKGFCAAFLTALLLLAGMEGFHDLFWKFNPNLDPGAAAYLSSQINQDNVETESFQNAKEETSEMPAPSDTMETAIQTESETAAENEVLPADVPADQPAAKEQTSYLQYVKDARATAHSVFTFEGRTEIWAAVVKGLLKNPRVLLFGIPADEIGQFIMSYLGEYKPHSHNSWLEITLNMGAAGLFFALLITYLAVRNAFSLLFFKKSLIWQKAVCVLMLTMMGTEFFEIYLFLPHYPTDFLNMAFMFLLGYVIFWNKNAECLTENKII